MKNDKEFVKDITNIDENFSTMVYRHCIESRVSRLYRCKRICCHQTIWICYMENIQKYADEKFKEHGVKNISMPVLIPESLLNKEKDHVEGFAPEVAWVTMEEEKN